MGTGAPLYMYWWFTPIQIADMLHRLGLAEADYMLDIYGNLLSRMAFLLNWPAEELTEAELEFADPGQPLLICARIVKPVNWQAVKPEYRAPCWQPQIAPVRSSPTTGHYGDLYNT
jgi:hypothetical protein